LLTRVKNGHSGDRVKCSSLSEVSKRSRRN
jgi:hypothetical protein